MLVNFQKIGILVFLMLFALIGIMVMFMVCVGLNSYL